MTKLFKANFNQDNNKPMTHKSIVNGCLGTTEII